MAKFNERTRLFKITVRVGKYFLLAIAGGSIAYFTAVVLGIGFLSHVLVSLFEVLFIRALVLLISLGAMSAITESLR